MHNTYAWDTQVVSNMLLSRSSCWSRAVWELRWHLDTLREMCRNHTRQLIVKCDYVDSSPFAVTGLVSERYVPVWRKVSTLASRNWGINDIGNAPRASTTPWLEWSGLQCNLVWDMSLRVFNPPWHSIGWSLIKCMTQSITHLHEGLGGDKHYQLNW